MLEAIWDKGIGREGDGAVSTPVPRKEACEDVLRPSVRPLSFAGRDVLWSSCCLPEKTVGTTPDLRIFRGVVFISSACMSGS